MVGTLMVLTSLTVTSSMLVEDVEPHVQSNPTTEKLPEAGWWPWASTVKPCTVKWRKVRPDAVVFQMRKRGVTAGSLTAAFVRYVLPDVKDTVPPAVPSELTAA